MKNGVFKIEKSIPKLLYGDPLRLEQVLTNLISNAIKFTGKGQVLVSVVATCLTSDSIDLQFQVQDTGIGIDQEQLQTLFAPFVQADGSISRRFGGTGLGLTISKTIVTLMNGSLNVKSQVGVGSTFEFSLHFGYAKESPLHEYWSEHRADIRGTRVLVADDNSSVREALEEMLLSFGCKVTAVSSGAAAIAELNRASHKEPNDRYKILLIDWNMPGMKGSETCKMIRQQKKYNKLPIIIMGTPHSQQDIHGAFKQLTPYCLLIKPVYSSILLDTMVHALSPKVVPSRSNTMLDIPNFSGYKVLVVEDNLINQQVADELLKLTGLQVKVIAQANEAINFLRTNHVDLVLMDIQIPDMDGFEATKLIREMYDSSTLYVIAMTAHALSGDRARCIAAGMNDHIPKPINPDNLYCTLSQWLKPSDASKPKRISNDNDLLSYEELPELDIQFGLGRIGGNQKLYLKLLSDFVVDHGKDIDKIKNALAINNYDAAKRVVHTLRSVTGTIGAQHIESIAESLEARLSGVSGSLEDLNTLDDAFSRLIHGLQRLLKRFVSNNRKLGDTSSDHVSFNQIGKLIEALSQGNAEAQALFEGSKSRLKKLLSHKDFIMLESQIEEFEFDEATLFLEKTLSVDLSEE